MGDDAELYWEMEHDPFFWNEVEEYNTPKRSSAVSKRKKEHKTREKKKNTALFIDGENISHKKANSILSVAKKQGELYSARVYGLQKDECTKEWSKRAKEYDIKDIRLCGAPAKDKVDKKIQKDAYKEIIQEKNIDIVCIATSDNGYVKTVRKLREQGKRVVVIGEDKAPNELRNACNQFIEI